MVLACKAKPSDFFNLVIRFRGEEIEIAASNNVNCTTKLALSAELFHKEIDLINRRTGARAVIPREIESLRRAQFDMEVFKKISSARLLYFDPMRMVGPAYSRDETPVLESNGHGLASVLAHLASTDPDKLRSIEEDLRKIVPITRRLRMPRAEVRWQEEEILTIDGQAITRPIKRQVWGNRLEVEIDGAGFLPAEMLSEGTLIVLDLLTVLHGPMPPRLMLIDDLERALHPKAQAELVRCLRRLLEERPDLQIICTSRSPYLLDSFEEKEVRVMSLGADGHARCQPLTAHPEWQQWKGSLSAGEFWSTVGEEWVAR